MSNCEEGLINYEFKGKSKMIHAFDQAIAAHPGNNVAQTVAVRDAMVALFHDPDVELPTCCMDPIDDHYARREIYRSPDLDYSVVAMTWGPDQGTPIHDHCGLWCVESVWQGELEIQQYELVEATAERERVRFEVHPCMNATKGSAGRLIPPHEYHTIHNRDATKPAISLHIYERAMVNAAMFEPTSDDPKWYSRSCKELKTDN